MKRQSNFELLRIIGMLMIIILHYFGSCDANNVLTPEKNNYIVYLTLESMCICGVNLFVLITGYFSVNSNTIKVRKIINLLIDVAFWGIVGYILLVLVKINDFNIINLIKTAFPFITGSRWFVKAYIILLLFIPFINKIINSISKKSYVMLLLIVTLLFSIWPSFFPHPPIDDYGYGFIHFIYLYLIAGYIKLYLCEVPRKLTCILGYLISLIIVVMSRLYGLGYSWAYNYIFVIFEAVFLFLLFKQLNFKSKTVNSLASCSFGVFLIHTDGFFSRLIYINLFGINAAINYSCIYLIINILLCAIVFYLFGYILEMCKRKIFSFSIDKILNRFVLFNKQIKIVWKE